MHTRLTATLLSITIASCQATPQSQASPDTPPAPSPEPIVEDLIARKDQLQLCQNVPFDPDLARKNAQVHALGDNQFLVTVVCGIREGQYIHENYRYETSTPPIVTPLTVAFRKINTNGEITRTIGRTVEGAGQYDPTTQTLKITTLFDQLGDCGMVGFYHLSPTLPTFEIQKLLAKPDCSTGYVIPKTIPKCIPSPQPSPPPAGNKDRATPH